MTAPTCLGMTSWTRSAAAIRLWDKALLCCSKDSLSRWWVDNEITVALAKEEQLTKQRRHKMRALILLNLDGHIFSGEWQTGKAEQVRSRLAADFTGWERRTTGSSRSSSSAW